MLQTIAKRGGTVCAVVLWLGSSAANAHVPYIEYRDSSAESPFIVEDVENSKAIYAHLDDAADVDVYAFEVTGEIEFFAELLVPACPEYRDFLPSFALIGPGLPAPTTDLPVDVPDGHGAVVFSSSQPRETFYEPFGGKRYYQGPRYETTLTTPGDYSLIYWDPQGARGDYVAVIGEAEVFEGIDLLRSLINTIVVRMDGELHTECGACCGISTTLPERQPAVPDLNRSSRRAVEAASIVTPR